MVRTTKPLKRNAETVERLDASPSESLQDMDRIEETRYKQKCAGLRPC